MKLEVVTTKDGSHSLFNPELNEQYHSINGALTESGYVYIEKGFSFSKSHSPVFFEVGFGTGLNALLTAIEAEKMKKNCLYYGIEKYPLDKKILHQLNYGLIISEEAQNTFAKIHESEWGNTVSINKYFTICKIKGDLKTYLFNEIPFLNVIYFDAFSPDKQPEMWTTEIFDKIANHTLPTGVIVTYSAKGEVRRQLNDAGFVMERLPGPPGKIHMLRGIKKESLII